jgi:hypothetical protein
MKRQLTDADHSDFLSVRKDAVESHFEMLMKHLDNAWNDFDKRSQTRVRAQTLGNVGGLNFRVLTNVGNVTFGRIENVSRRQLTSLD